MELTDLVKILRSHWIALIAGTLAGGLLAFGFALTQPKVYTANASGIISTGQSEDLSAALAGDNYAKSRVKSYLDLAQSRAVAEIVIDDLGLEMSSTTLLERVTVSNPLDTATIKVAVEAGNPEDAQARAEAWISAIGTQIDAVENAFGENNSIVRFASLDTAELPTTPSSPNVKIIAAIGLLGGLATAVSYAFIRNMFDRRIRSVEVVENETGENVIGTIPFHNHFGAGARIIQSLGSNDPGSAKGTEYAVAEAVRDLRTNLQFMDVDNPPRQIVVTSALPAEGKSIITANLANAIAASGQRVVVIDADLRRPMVAKTFGLVAGAGLTDILIGRAAVRDVLQPYGNTGNLFVLSAGRVPPNPSELLASKAMSRLLGDLAKHSIVLIDAPPLLPVTDSAILAARTDGALVVAFARRTTYDQLNEALQNLERVNARALGLIINGVPLKGTGADGYGYRYRYYAHYGAHASEQRAPEVVPSTIAPSPTPATTPTNPSGSVPPVPSPVFEPLSTTRPEGTAPAAPRRARHGRR